MEAQLHIVRLLRIEFNYRYGNRRCDFRPPHVFGDLGLLALDPPGVLLFGYAHALHDHGHAYIFSAGIFTIFLVSRAA